MKTIKLIYLVGSYPQLSTTFIDRGIETLQQLGDFKIQTVSVHHPRTLAATLPEYQEVREKTLYLIPTNWWTFIKSNFHFIFRRPLIYFGTLIYLLTRNHPRLKDRLMTILHFGLGVYAAYLLRQQDFDHLHVHFIDRSVVLALVIGRLLDKSYSLTAHANSIYVKKVLIREKIANAKFMVTVSEYNKSYLLDTYPGLNSNKIHVLRPSVSLSDFAPPAPRPHREKLFLLSVGRLVEKKGHVYLIEACHLLQQQGIDFECRIVGDGPLRQELETRIARCNLESRVYLTGGQPQHEVRRLLTSWADVFVLPCVIAKDGDRDGIPESLVEAMATELPVISTDIVGIGELVRPGAGILVAPYDPSALAVAVHTIYDKSPSSRVEMGRRGRALVEAEFNLLNRTTRLANLFREAINSKC